MMDHKFRSIESGQDTIRGILGDPAQDDALPLADCAICREIPERSYLLHIPARDESIGGYPAAYVHLRDLIELSDQEMIKQCPRCGRLYLDESHYEYLAGGSEDEYILTRLSRQQAIAHLEQAGVRALRWDEGHWQAV